MAPTVGGSTDAPDWGFTSQRFEKAAGIYDYNARWYDPEIGRFLQPDSIVPSPFSSQSLNRYAYVGNDPVNYVDPTGHFAFLIPSISVSGLGGAAPGRGGGGAPPDEEEPEEPPEDPEEPPEGEPPCTGTRCDVLGPDPNFNPDYNPSGTKNAHKILQKIYSSRIADSRAVITRLKNEIAGLETDVAAKRAELRAHMATLRALNTHQPGGTSVGVNIIKNIYDTEAAIRGLQSRIAEKRGLIGEHEAHIRQDSATWRYWKAVEASWSSYD